MTPIGNQYGQALYDLAHSEGAAQEILQQLTALREGFAQEADYIRLLSTPTLSKQERCAIVDEGFSGRLHPYVLNFLKILTEKGYMRHFADCAEQFTQCYDRDNGILPVTAVTALPLPQAQADKLREKLAQLTGKTIRLTNRVEEDCLGGIRLEYAGKRIDDTLAHRLDQIGKLLKNTVI